MDNVTVHDLSSGRVKFFDKHTDPKYACAYAYCEAHSEPLFEDFIKHTTEGSLDLIFEELPFVEGEKTISCGDWCALKGGMDYGQTG